MSNYLRWAGWQFYLVLFWPSRFDREMDALESGEVSMSFGQRLSYMGRLLPCIALLAILSNLSAGFVTKLSSGGYDWAASWSSTLACFGGIFVFGLVCRAAIGLPLGLAVGVVVGITLGVWHGIAIAVVFGVLSGILAAGKLKVSREVGIGGAIGAALGITYGTVFGFPLGFTFGTVFALAFYLGCFRLVSYPLDALLAWLTHRAARAQPAAAFRWWRCCPVVWNEVIYLPLPGAGKLLALATRQNREEGFKQIAFVAAERKLQRRVVLEALAEVALGDLEASATETISSTPERLAWTSQSPLALPKDLNEALPRFDRASHQASQFLSVSSANRKADALKRAVEEVDALQRTHMASPGKFAPRLLQIANQWRAVLEAEQAGLKQFAAERRETPNPFIYGNPVDERSANVFAGRQDVARQIEESLLGARQSPALLLHGPRRMGKSSILKQLPRLLGPDFAPATLDCQNPAVGGGEASTASLLRYLSASLSEGLQRRRVAVKPLTAEELAREPFAAFDAWLARVEQAMPAAMRALLCLDEYERLQRALDAGWGGDFLDALRHTLQHRPRFVLLFTGAHTFAEMGPAWTDRFISARRVRVSFLQPDDVRPLLTKPIPEFDLTYASGAVEAVIAATRCQPFLVQAVAFELVQYLNEPQQQRKEAMPADVETAITRALESGGEYFANVWSDAGAEGQGILQEIARTGVAADVSRRQSFRHPASGIGDQDQDQRGLTSTASGALKWLREHDVLDDAGCFAVPMVERWVRENRA